MVMEDMRSQIQSNERALGRKDLHIEYLEAKRDSAEALCKSQATQLEEVTTERDKLQKDSVYWHEEFEKLEYKHKKMEK